MNYTKQIEELAKELGVNVSVAIDIDYLRSLERRILAVAKVKPEARFYCLECIGLEEELEKFEDQIGLYELTKKKIDM